MDTSWEIIHCHRPTFPEFLHTELPLALRNRVKLPRDKSLPCKLQLHCPFTRPCSCSKGITTSPRQVSHRKEILGSPFHTKGQIGILLAQHYIEENYTNKTIGLETKAKQLRFLPLTWLRSSPRDQTISPEFRFLLILPIQAARITEPPQPKIQRQILSYQSLQGQPPTSVIPIAQKPIESSTKFSSPSETWPLTRRHFSQLRSRFPCCRQTMLWMCAKYTTLLSSSYIIMLENTFISNTDMKMLKLNSASCQVQIQTTYQRSKSNLGRYHAYCIASKGNLVLR